jgi:hypothetical protein
MSTQDPIRAALAELLAAYEAKYPFESAGQVAQTAWCERQANARDAARLILSTPTEAAQPAWFRLVWDIGQKVGCLASSFPDGNEHILRAIDRLVSVEPAQPAGESSGEPKPFTRAQLNRLWDNSPEHHGDATSRSAFERIVALVEAAHGIAAKQPGAESAACNSNEGRTE